MSEQFTTGNSGASLPLSASSFGQAPEQDERLFGEAQIRFPSGVCNEGMFGSMEADVAIDGRLTGILELTTSPSHAYVAGASRTIPIIWISAGFPVPTSWLSFEAGSSSQTHAISIEAGDDCTDAGAGHFTVESLSIDVLS